MLEPKSLLRLITFAHMPDGQDSSPVVETIPIPLGKTPPAHRLICLYGNPMAALKRIRKEAIKAKKKIFRVDLDVPRGETIISNTSLDNIKTTKILPLDRLDAKLSKALNDLLLKPGDNFEFEKPNYIIGEQPERLNLIWKDPRFEHLSVIVWSAPLSKDTPGFEKRAALKSLDLIVKKDIRNFPGDPETVRFLI